MLVASSPRKCHTCQATIRRQEGTEVLRPTNIRLEEAIQRRLERIKSEGQSASSIYTTEHALDRFHRWLAAKQPRNPNPFVHLISPDRLDDYCFGKDGIRQGVKAVTFNRYRSVLKVFFDYCRDMRWIDQNPMTGVASARRDAPVKRLLLSGQELLSLLDHCTGPTGPIERIACAVGMNTGLRANDVRHLTVLDANLTSGEIQTEIRKTKRLDVKPITADLESELVRWFQTYALLAGVADWTELPESWLLVPTCNVAPPRAGSVVTLFPDKMHTHPWRLVQRPLASLGFPTKGEGFHTLRRSSARAFFERLRHSGAGRDHALMIVKDFLNHASVTQTEVYLGMTAERTIRDELLKGKSFLSAQQPTTTKDGLRIA